MKIVFFGTPRFAVPVLETLAFSKHEIAAVVTQPDRPVGRNQELSSSSVKEAALHRGITVLQPESVKDPAFFNAMQKINPDLSVIVAFGQIMPENLIYLPRYRTVNIHASLLPKYRGASPINAAIINGDKETGITYQFIDKGLDTGDIIQQEKLLIGQKDTSITLSEKLSNLAADTVLAVVDMIRSESYTRVKQDGSKATMTRQLKKEDGKIDFKKGAIAVYNLVRGLLPWPGAYCILDNKALKIWSSAPVEYSAPDAILAAGQVADITREHGIIVKTGDGFVSFTDVQLEGGRRLDGFTFSIGQRDLKGKILA